MVFYVFLLLSTRMIVLCPACELVVNPLRTRHCPFPDLPVQVFMLMSLFFFRFCKEFPSFVESFFPFFLGFGGSEERDKIHVFFSGLVAFPPPPKKKSVCDPLYCKKKNVLSVPFLDGWEGSWGWQIQEFAPRAMKANARPHSEAPG